MKLRVASTALAAVFAFGVAILPSLAHAGPVGGPVPTFTIHASSSLGGDVLDLNPSLVAAGGGTYTTSGSDSTPSFSLAFEFTTLDPDPTVSGSFTLTNLSAVTQVFSLSATLGVLPVAGPTKIGGSYGDATYTDANGDKSVTFSSAAFYRALIDAAGVHDLGSFAINLSSDTPGLSGTISKESFGVPIPSDPGPGVAGSIGVAFPGFSLSAGDSVSVPFEFVVVPEPGFASLFASGFTLILLARARKKGFQRASELW